MFDVKIWLEEIKAKILDVFGARVVFVGFQGSYRRGEATDASDIDLVVILDELCVEDLQKYREIVQSMPYFEKACGFISGKAEIECWSKSDIFQFYFETEVLYGDFRDFVTAPSVEDIRTAVKTGAANLYHAACHSFVFDEKAFESLAALYKMAFFILQAKYYISNGRYIVSKRELLPLLSNLDAEILEICIKKNFDEENYAVFYDKLVRWCSFLLYNNR